ncbi:MAG: peptide-methionine (S)-S-oxide reductase MsrA [Candidatus Poseidoniales archaeon]|tara:strand:+ start:858 stop:1313 length:456 start_codon:yes stop_codon:yes gene_type:complete
MSKAMFGAGCFWGVEYNFAKLKGVREVLSGYSGGKTPNPTYEQVCSNSTEHAEVVMIDYDETQISYEELLDAFWRKHDPTTLNRQGPDVGDQYRSAIFYFDEEQQTLARESLKNLQQKLERSIVTEITKADTFWKAEEYHQKYFEKHNLRH